MQRVGGGSVHNHLLPQWAVFSNQFPAVFLLGILWLLETWPSCTLPFYSFSGVSCLLHFETSPHLPQLFGRMLRCCSAMKLQKCFVDYWLSNGMAGGWADDDWIFFSFLFLVHCSFKIVNTCSKNQNNRHPPLWSLLWSLTVLHPHRRYITMVRCSCISGRP